MNILMSNFPRGIVKMKTVTASKPSYSLNLMLARKQISWAVAQGKQKKATRRWELFKVLQDKAIKMIIPRWNRWRKRKQFKTGKAVKMFTEKITKTPWRSKKNPSPRPPTTESSINRLTARSHLTNESLQTRLKKQWNKKKMHHGK